MPPVSDERSILNLLEEYCWTVDRKMWDEWSHCFTEDGVFAVRGQRLVGREAIVDYVRSSIGDYTLVRHLVHQAHLQIDPAGKTAVVRSYFELRGTTGSGKDVEALGSYRDEVEKTPGGWKFKERKATFDYYVPRGQPWNRGAD